MPKISVIVPIYNVEEYLHRCVDSILAQTFTDFELILVDDGSPDNCGRICDEYAEKDSRIHVIHKENGGLASARAVGIQRATGEYISFCDSDDYIKNDFLETLFNTIIANECQCVSSMFILASDNTCKDVALENINGLYLLASAKEVIEHTTILLQNISGWEVWSKLFRLDLIKKHGIVDVYLDVCHRTGSYAEDLCFYLLYLFHCERVYYLDYCGYYYYQRSDSLIHNSPRKVHLNEMNEVSYGLFHYVNEMCDRQLYKNYPLIHLCIIAIPFREIEEYQDIPQITKRINRKTWYKMITKKSLSFRKSLEKICGKNKAFKILNTAFFSIHCKYGLFKWLDIIFYKFFAER